MIDLHIHTTMSDGQYAPTEIVNLSVQQNLSIISITDHDTLSGLEEGALAAEKANLQFIPGIEISVKGNKELHILGYCIDIYNSQLNKMCEKFKLFREEREQRILSYLHEKNIELTAEQVEKQAAHGRIGRPHFARAMLDAGYVSTYREAFDRYLATPDFDKIERPKPESQEGICAIRGAGGVAVLAHPSQLKLNNEELESLLQDLIKAGLKGMECYYSTHTKENTAFYLWLAKKYNLIVTGGSDFHGEKIKPDIEIGTGIHNSLYFDDKDIIQKLREAGNDKSTAI